ncbi:MAG: PAS domain-containing protein [Lentisphaerae bacterium]|nr:PAS domain-containing protein [Lentisphaerota bacterium]
MTTMTAPASDRQDPPDPRSWMPAAADWTSVFDARSLGFFVVSIVGLVILAHTNYLAAHCIVEGWAIVVAILAFLFSRYTRTMARDGYLQFLGLVYGAVAALDFVHTLAYRGMGVFDLTSGNAAAQLWVAARWLEALGLLLAPWLSRRRWHGHGTVALLAGYVTAVTVLILHTDLFPDCFIEGTGLTLFKIGSELVICLVLMAAVAGLFWNRKAIGGPATALLVTSVLLTIASELMFMSYHDAYDILNVLGHAFKGLSFYCVFLIIVRQGFIEPLEFRRRAEVALREQDRLLHLAMEGARVGFWEWHEDTGMVTLDPQFIESMGFTQSSSRQVPYDGFSKVVHPDDLARFEAVLDQHRAGHLPYAEADLRVRDAAGGWRWVQIRGHVVESDAKGQPRCILGFVQDITARKKAESELRDLRADLGRAQRATIAGQLLATLAHEINQPLAAICSNARAAQRILAAAPPQIDEMPAILDDIAADGQRASAVVQRLREYIRRGRTDHQGPVAIAALIEETLRVVRDELAEHHVAVSTQIPCGLPRLVADRVQLQQVVVNLVRNAVESMAEAPDPAHPPRLAIGASREEDAVHLTVADNGPGIPSDQADSVFVPFRTTRPDGLGMGLVICRSIVEAHGGRIEWTPNPDRGTTFHVTLPLPHAADAT